MIDGWVVTSLAFAAGNMEWKGTYDMKPLCSTDSEKDSISAAGDQLLRTSLLQPPSPDSFFSVVLSFLSKGPEPIFLSREVLYVSYLYNQSSNLMLLFCFSWQRCLEALGSNDLPAPGSSVAEIKNMYHYTWSNFLF